MSLIKKYPGITSASFSGERPAARTGDGVGNEEAVWSVRDKLGLLRVVSELPPEHRQAVRAILSESGDVYSRLRALVDNLSSHEDNNENR